LINDGGSGYGVILLSFLVAAILAVLPLPLWLSWGRPEWIALALIYWTIALPHRVGLFTALLLGIALDVLEGAVFGQNAFSLTVVTFLALVLYQRVRVYSLGQQAGVVFILVGVNQLICQWMQNLQDVGAQSFLFLLPAVSSALLWPVVLAVLRGLRRYYQVT
jgi:rod shape-determining protein MreD